MKPSTDIITFSEQLQSKIRERLDDPNTDQDEMHKIANVLAFIRGLIDELKVFTASYKFRSEDEEIKFFKEIKPILLSQYFYYKKVFSLLLFDSFRDVKSRQCNYSQMLEQLECFMKKNREFYQYCITNTTYLDKQYFTRNNQIKKSINQDEHFTTRYDTKLAKILANELFRNYVLAALQRSQTETTGLTLTWTAHKAWLIELIYALHSMEVINKGSADIKLIASTFENLFNISLGNYYRVIQEIRIRKTDQTIFLNQLKDKLQKRLNDYK